MSGPAPAPAARVALFDLDGTLTWHDTLLPYLANYAWRHPRCWWRLAGVPLALVDFCLKGRDRGLLKSRLIRAVMGGAPRPAIDAWSDEYVASLTRRGAFRPKALAALAAHREAGDHLVLLSASPDLYVPRIGRLLGFERTVCTEIGWARTAAGVERLEGGLVTANRRGTEKSLCLAGLREHYPGLAVVAYGNSDSDLPHLIRADRGVLVNGAARARRQARLAGVAVDEWS